MRPKAWDGIVGEALQSSYLIPTALLSFSGLSDDEWRKHTDAPLVFKCGNFYVCFGTIDPEVSLRVVQVSTDVSLKKKAYLLIMDQRYGLYVQSVMV